MRIFLLIVFILLAGTTNYAQQLHFAYLQTDTHKPFYVTLNKKNYSSTASGYIILPKLQNGDYPLRIGFAKNEEAEQEYLLQVKDNDQGFLIKDFGDKGWGLFNLQTMAVQYAGTAAQERAKLAAAEKAAADERQRKLDEELLAAETQRRNDSLKTVAFNQKAYADSIAAIIAANQQRTFEDSLSRANSAVLQKEYDDSVAAAKAVARENERLEKIADSTARAQSAAIEKQKKKETDAEAAERAKAIARENERLEKIADSTAREQAATIKKQREEEAAAKVENTKAAVREAERLQKLADSTERAQVAAFEKKKENVEIEVKTENPNVTTKPTNKAQVKKNDSVKKTQPPALIQQIFTDTGWHYAYNVTNNGQRETVDVFIPYTQPKLPVNIIPIEEKEIVPASTVKPDSTKFLNISIGLDTATAINDSNDSIETKPDSVKPIIAGNVTSQQPEVKDSISVAAEKPVLNPNCRALANEKDFLTARRKLASSFGTDAMLITTRKILKEKCFTTEQLRNLCVLFLTDAGRYQFLDAAYPFAFDAYHYNQLQDLLIDDYYVQRFKAMLR